MPSFKDATLQQIDEALQQSWKAFHIYSQRSLKQRADFLRSIAKELDDVKDELIAIASKETNLEKQRLEGELKRTIFQLTSYADACEQGSWLDVRIDIPVSNSHQSSVQKKEEQVTVKASTVQHDLRKMLIPLGPVVVFGASNFPFAYSTAGGDTACALAAGCSVIVKAHPAHAKTSELVSKAIKLAIKKNDLPDDVFIHLHGAAFEVGKALVQHKFTRAVGFTGSFEGGKALFDLANQREIPIPVFAEMGSVNPVFLLPEKLKADTQNIASMYAASITQSAGQFCTNPGILVAIEDESLEVFKTLLGTAIEKVKPAKMLHVGIAKSFHQKREKALSEKDVTLTAITGFVSGEDESIPTIAEVAANIFLQNPLLHKEVFGPFSLLVKCKNADEMLQVALSLEGQLTTSLLATDAEVKKHQPLVMALQNICGRFVLNGVPTGVEVALSMHHGGPYPATTDSRFTAVGADGIRRFARPFCFQNWPNDLLPDELKNENPVGIWRTVNNRLTRQPIT